MRVATPEFLKHWCVIEHEMRVHRVTNKITCTGCGYNPHPMNLLLTYSTDYVKPSKQELVVPNMVDWRHRKRGQE